MQKRIKRSIPSHSLSTSNLIPPLQSPPRKRRDSSLHPNLDSFPRTQENIGDEFSGGRGSEVECCTVFMGRFFAYEVCVFFLEEFVETVFSSAWKMGLAGVGSRGGRGWKRKGIWIRGFGKERFGGRVKEGEMEAE